MTTRYAITTTRYCVAPTHYTVTAAGHRVTLTENGISPKDSAPTLTGKLIPITGYCARSPFCRTQPIRNPFYCPRVPMPSAPDTCSRTTRIPSHVGKLPSSRAKMTCSHR